MMPLSTAETAVTADDVSYQYGRDFGAWVDEAIRLASDLLVDGWDGAATVEVASLPSGTIRSDADLAIRSMLAEHGIPLAGPGSTQAEKLQVMQQAFANDGISVGEFAAELYENLAPCDEQDPAMRQLVVLLDRWENARTAPQERQALAAEMRATASLE